MSPSAELGGADEAAASSGAAASDGDHMSGATTGVPPGASLLVLDEFVLESGQKLAPCPVAYTTYGTLNSAGTNVVVVEHSLTSNSNVHEWWSPMLGDGPEFAIDTSQSFVFCANYLGSPYGTASPLTHKENSNAKGEPFPICTIRDNVRLQHTVLERLGMKNVKLCIGGSMGAMVAIEWACTYPELVTGDVVLIAGCGRHTAWAIALSEAQRFAIRGDAVTGLAAARMMAMLAYRAPSSIDDKFSRRAAALLRSDASTPVEGIPSPAKDSSQTSQDVDEDSTPINLSTLMDGTFSTERSLRRIRTSSWQNLHDSTERNGLPPMCSAAYDVESYLHHQGLKFVRRFDPECYVSLTLSMDTHDIGRARDDASSPQREPAAAAPAPSTSTNGDDEAYDGDAGDRAYYARLSSMSQRTLVVGISSDVLYPLSLQEELALHIPKSSMYTIESHHGHDAFLIEIDALNAEVISFLRGTEVSDKDSRRALLARREASLAAEVERLREEMSRLQ